MQPWFYPLVSVMLASSANAATFHLAPDGDDANPGSASQPLRTLVAAETLARSATGPVTLVLHGGTYRLDRPLVLTPADNGMTIVGAPDEEVTLSGSIPLALAWTPYKNHILQAVVPAAVETIDQLFVNDDATHMARYPNFDPAVPVFNGYAPDVISPERIKSWADPTGGFIHALHTGRWGSMDFRITSKNVDGTLAMEGGWQINRPSPMHKQFRYVENVFEELDAPNEWFFNGRTHVLYFYPPNGLDMKTARVETVHLESLIRVQGDDAEHPVKNIILRHLTLTHTDRTFMQTREPILRSDWCIARTGAIVLKNSENCTLDHVNIEYAGGNGIFVDSYNKHATVDTCHIHGIGASAACFVGDPRSVRDPLFAYKAAFPADHVADLTPGPVGNSFPQDCVVTDSLIHDIGQTEKQSAGVEIDIAGRITVSDCSIYHTPRAGINIGDGCFGGHRIEGNDVFDTVLETSDHGAFNSWGRDRFWSPDRKVINQRVAANSALPLLDVVEPNTLVNNRFRCDHGWDIDLDDGSSNYVIVSNVLLSGGLKLREGYDRHADNNILLNNTLFAHVWLDHSQDTVTHNIFMRSYRPTGMPKSSDGWGVKVDNNIFTQPASLEKARAIGLDRNSAAGDPQFLDARSGNFQVGENSPALAVGFKNVPINFGVTDPVLRKIARTPTIPPITTNDDIADPLAKPVFWMGASVKGVTTDAEVSATGLSEKSGVLLLEVPANSPAAAAGLHKLDVILKADNVSVHTPDELANLHPKLLTLMRNQSETKVSLP